MLKIAVEVHGASNMTNSSELFGASGERARDAMNPARGGVRPQPAPNPTDSADRNPRIGPPVRVSTVVPCYNEARFIEGVLSTLATQYGPGGYEVIVVDGMSTDGTREIVADFIRRRPLACVRLVDNPARNIPAALNAGIDYARGEIIVRMDAHAVPSANYVRDCVGLLDSSDAAIVGMPCRVRPGADTLTARAVAAAVSHPFGIGDATYRLAGSKSQYVDTVAFGAFRKSLWRELGGYNEGLLTNEDYDFNYRARLLGGRILLDASGHCDYFARTTLRGLGTQYSRYGKWKAEMLRLHPRSVRWRHLVAPTFVLSLILLPALGLLWPPAMWAWGFIVAAYFALSLTAGLVISHKEGDYRLVPLLCLAFLVIHVTWGASFVLSFVRGIRAL